VGGQQFGEVNRTLQIERRRIMHVRKTLSAIALGLVIAGSAIPGFAQRSDYRSNASRDAAVRDCSMKASKHSNGAEQTTQFAVYSNCMIEHGQQP
jgi:aspartate ammonia-lyase